MSFITAIGTANPSHRFPQSQIAEFMLSTMHLQNGDARKLKAIFKSSGIAYRYSVLSDYGKSTGFDFYPNEKELMHPSTGKRLVIYREHAVALSIAATNEIIQEKMEDLQTITHLIVVSCTGMYAPGLDIDLVKKLGLKLSVQRTAINFMGCYAAFNALKVADALCTSDEQARVLIICTELCSLHFQTEPTEDNLLANALFADGAAAMLVEAKPSKGLNLELLDFHNDLYLNGDESMAWTVGDVGFEMKLSSYVPEMIREGISALTGSLLEKVGMQISDIEFYAIHPGGKRILQIIEEELNIDRERNAAAYEVLEKYGNMSSATVVFVLQQLLSKMSTKDDGKKILSFAFGPGLTMESMLLKVKSN